MARIRERVLLLALEHDLDDLVRDLRNHVSYETLAHWERALVA
jgi:hypothetical protein